MSLDSIRFDFDLSNVNVSSFSLLKTVTFSLLYLYFISYALRVTIPWRVHKQTPHNEVHRSKYLDWKRFADLIISPNPSDCSVASIYFGPVWTWWSPLFLFPLIFLGNLLETVPSNRLQSHCSGTAGILRPDLKWPADIWNIREPPLLDPQVIWKNRYSRHSACRTLKKRPKVVPAPKLLFQSALTIPMRSDHIWIWTHLILTLFPFIRGHFPLSFCYSHSPTFPFVYFIFYFSQFVITCHLWDLLIYARLFI